MTYIILYLVIIAVTYLTAYVVSLYSLAVYIDPEELESLFPEVSRRRKDLLMKLAAEPRVFMQITAIYKSFVLVLVTLVAVLALERVAGLIGYSRYYLLLAGLPIIWLFYITFVEFLPRRSSRRAINTRMSRYLWLIGVVYQVFSPVVYVYRLVLRRLKQEDKVTEEEKEEIVERAIETLAEQAGIDERIVEEDEKEMIGHIFLLDQTVVREIMSPRIDITGIEKTTSFADIRKIVREDGHSRFPVYEQTIDRVIGILYVKDLFNSMPQPGEEFIITKYLRKPYFVPESKVIGDLLREFKEKKLHIAVVVDEYGGISGLVTLEDILEEIVGEIQDEHDTEELPIAEQPDGSYLVDASFRVEELQDHMDTDYEQGEYDTIGGLIYDLVGSVPVEGAKVRWHNLEFEVLSREGQRIKRVGVRKK